MKKVIGFCLYGSDYNGKYGVGAVCNAEIAKELFPDWTCIFYVSNTYNSKWPLGPNEDVVESLKKLSNVEIRYFNDDGNPGYNKTRRFLPVDDNDVDVFLSRDTDSRLSKREKYLVDIFLQSDKLFHSINDHHLHGHIMGGMWGIKRGALEIPMNELIESSPCVRNTNDGDQVFMFNVIGPKVKQTTLFHRPGHNVEVPFSSVNPFRPDITHFIGQIFDNNFGKPRNFIFY